MDKIVKLLVRLYFAIVYRVTITGMENVPKKGAAILCANHIGQLDMFFIGYKLKRLVHYMAKEELFRNPVLSFILKRLGSFPVRRGKGDIGAIKTAFHLLDGGHIVGILPEGTRTHGEDRAKFKANPGAVMVSLQKKAPIIPVGIEGTYKPFTRVKVVFGKPFYLKAEPGRKYSVDEMTEMSSKLMDRIYGLVEEK